MAEEKRNRVNRGPRAIVGTYSAGADRYRAETAPKTNWPVVIITATVTVAVAVWAAVAGDNFKTVINGITGWLTGSLGWLYVATVAIALIFMIWIAMSKAGNLRLGPDHSKPQYSLFSWSAMLFAAGIGIGVMFYSVAEPLAQYSTPPVGPGMTEKAYNEAIGWTLFHWGVSGWALYALMGLAFGYYAYRLNMPLAIRSALYPLIGKRIHGPIGDAVDVAALLGTIFGVAASLGIGVVQLNFGLHMIFGLPEGHAMQIALVAIAVGVAAVSAVSGVDKGIKRLSEANVYLATALLLFVLFTGRTGWLLNSAVKNVGDYLAWLPRWTFETFSYSQDPGATADWMANWTLFFWAWWVAWAPFVGLFLARISRGRTFRQFIVGTLVVPFLFVALWASILGNTALDRAVNRGDADFLHTAVDQPERGFYTLLQALPGGSVVVVIAIAVGLLFFVTSADSGALVMAKFSSFSTNASQDGAPWLRLMWSGAVAVLTIAMLQVGGIATLQMATLIMGLPFMVVIYLIMIGLVRSLRMETAQVDSRAVALHSAISGRTTPSTNDVDWENRLDRTSTWPSEYTAQRYVVQIAKPALESIAVALRDRGYDATLLAADSTETKVPQLDLSIAFGEDPSFRYQLYPVPSRTPEFAVQEGGNGKLDNSETYVRLEVFGMNGSLGFDVFGYSRSQLINNVLDLFDRHLEYLHMQQDFAGERDLSEFASEAPEWGEDFGE